MCLGESKDTALKRSGMDPLFMRLIPRRVRVSAAYPVTKK